MGHWLRTDLDLLQFHKWNLFGLSSFTWLLKVKGQPSFYIEFSWWMFKVEWQWSWYPFSQVYPTTQSGLVHTSATLHRLDIGDLKHFDIEISQPKLHFCVLWPRVRIPPRWWTLRRKSRSKLILMMDGTHELSIGQYWGGDEKDAEWVPLIAPSIV